MKTRDEVLQMLAQQKSLLLAIYQITRLGIFRSYARGEQTDESDIDILVEYEKAPSLYQLIELRDNLSELFAIKRRFKSEVHRRLISLNRILQKGFYSQVIFWVYC